MIDVTFYKAASGNITRIAVLDPSLVEVNTLEGELWVEGHYDQNTQRVVDGVVVDIPQSELEDKEIQSAWASLREGRASRLIASDWTQVPDAPVDKAAWAAYRQELRDLPANTEDPREVVWPTPPA